MKINILLILSLITLYGCNNKVVELNQQGFLSINGIHFVDQNERTVILNGLNHVNKNPEQNYLHEGDELLFKQFNAWGFNFIRYGINWAALEPRPGEINEEYLQEIDKRVQWAEENGIWIMFDMHQDLYGKKFGNGAPEWATFDEGLPHQTGTIWSDAYLLSGAVQKSFDNFWANKLASDGVGIQDHYINVWKIIAERYVNSPSVAGFDLMNEPFMGSEAQKVFPELIKGYANGIYQKEGKVLAVDQLMQLFGDESSRVEILASLNDKNLYRMLLEPASEIINNFEQGELSNFYQKARDAIRSVNKHQIIFLEHNYFCNLGIQSQFKIPKDEKGDIDTLCAYAPHGYDLTTDTNGANNPGTQRVEFIFEQIFSTSKQKKMPTVIGEWGAYYLGEDKYIKAARQIVEFIEANLAGQSYWCYWNDIDKQDYFKAVLSRSYPMMTNGTLLSYKNDFDNNTFTCSWVEQKENQTITRIFIDNITELDQQDIQITPSSSFVITPIDNQLSGYLDISPIGESRNIIIN